MRALVRLRYPGLGAATALYSFGAEGSLREEDKEQQLAIGITKMFSTTSYRAFMAAITLVMGVAPSWGEVSLDDVASWGASQSFSQAQGEAITAAVDIVLDGLLDVPVIQEGTKIAIRENRSAILTSVRSNVARRLANASQRPSGLSISKYVGGAIAGAVSSAVAEELTRLMTERSGYGLRVTVAASVQENAIKTTANALLSGGNIHDFALSQTVLFVENTAKAVIQANEASGDAQAADMAELRLALTTAQSEALDAIMDGQSQFEVLRAYDNEIDRIKNNPPRRVLTWLVPWRGFQYNDYVLQKIEEYQFEVRPRIVTFYEDFVDTEATQRNSTSSFNSLIDGLVDSVNVTVPEFDFRSILSKPITGEVAQEGTVDEFIALSGNDLQTEQTVLVAEFASPDDDTGTPGVDGGGDEGGGGEDGDQDGDRDSIDPEVPASDITNVVVSTVSLPASDGNIRYSGPLISEDGNTIRYDSWGIQQSQSAKIEGFNHLYWGTGTDGLQWIYGEAATPEQYELRTGTATFRGGLIGYYAHGNFDNNTVYQDENPMDPSGNDVEGSLILDVNFSSNTLTGSGILDIHTPVRNENLRFTLNQANITENNSGLTRSLGFSTNASLDDGVVGSGNFSGTFYGSNASEAVGSFFFGLSGGFATGVWATGENYTFEDGQGDNGSIGQITSQSLSRFIADAGISSGEDTNPTFTDVPVDQGAGGGEVRLVNKFNHDSASDPYTYTSWGDWVANDNTIPNFSEGGYWVTADTMTPASVIENRTGTASYSGNIVGDYVSNGARQDATGLIDLTADFSADTIQGQMQFGHDGAGTNAGGTISPVANLVDVPIHGNSFGQSAVDQNTGNGLNSFGVSGFFAGPNAEEVGGTAWMHLDDGSYNGVFRAGQ